MNILTAMKDLQPVCNWLMWNGYRLVVSMASLIWYISLVCNSDKKSPLICYIIVLNSTLFKIQSLPFFQYILARDHHGWQIQMWNRVTSATIPVFWLIGSQIPLLKIRLFSDTFLRGSGCLRTCEQGAGVMWDTAGCGKACSIQWYATHPCTPSTCVPRQPETGEATSEKAWSITSQPPMSSDCTVTTRSDLGIENLGAHSHS